MAVRRPIPGNFENSLIASSISFDGNVLNFYVLNIYHKNNELVRKHNTLLGAENKFQQSLNFNKIIKFLLTNINF